MMRFIAPMLGICALVGCAPYAKLTGVPLAAPTVRNPLQLYAIMQPLCIFLCSNPISTIREDLTATGTDGAITSGAKSSAQTTTATGGNGP